MNQDRDQSAYNLLFLDPDLDQLSYLREKSLDEYITLDMKFEPHTNFKVYICQEQDLD